MGEKIKASKKELICACCKRPFRKPNLGFYNLPEVGAVCIDCSERIKKITLNKNGYALPKETKKYIENMRRRKMSFSACYKTKNLQPFELTIDTNSWGQVLSFNNLDEIKKLRNVLNEFIEKCEVGNERGINITILRNY